MVDREEDMKIKYRGLSKEPLPSGAFRYRVRVRGNKKKRFTLPVGPEHKEFKALYDDAREGISPKLQGLASREMNPSTVSWLCAAYLEHLEEAVEAGTADQKTLTQRKSFARQLREEVSESENAKGKKFAELNMAIPSSELLKMRDRMMKKPGSTANMFKFLRAMYSWAVDRGHCTDNPAKDIKVAYKSAGGAKPWTLDDLELYRKAHPFGTPAHLCLTLFMFTACRIGDAYRLGRMDEFAIDGTPWLGWQPAKKGSSYVEIPILPPLRQAIRSTTVIGETYLLTAHGRPFRSPEGLRNRFKKWCGEAGLSGLSSHGIRKAAGHLLSLHGATQYEIMAVHGHANASTSEIYTKGVERQRLAASAVAKLEGLKW